MHESFGFSAQQIKQLLGKEVKEFPSHHQEYVWGLLQQLAQLRELEKQSQVKHNPAARRLLYSNHYPV